MPAAYSIASSAEILKPKSRQHTSNPHHCKQATQRRASSSAGHRHRQGDIHRLLKGVSRPKITKSLACRAIHSRHGSAGAVGKDSSCSVAASGKTAVRLSKAELRREKALQLFVATATQEDKQARKVNRDFSDKQEHPAQPTQLRAQQRAQPPTEVFSVQAMKKRKVWQQALWAGFGWHS